MKNRLFWKFLLAYVLIGVASFVLIATIGSKWWRKAWWKPTAARLYLEADQIASSQDAIYHIGRRSPGGRL